jgi:hypothetical protein
MKRYKWAIIAGVSVTALMLITLFTIIPYAYGLNFVSFSFQLEYASGPGRPTMEIVYINGSIVPVAWIGLKVSEANTYFVPVHITHNGFDYVMLIYNRTVNNPDDITQNKNFLVWGAFYGGQLYPPSDALYYYHGFEYYASRRGLANYSETIPVGTFTYSLILYDYVTPVFRAENLNGNPISPGVYHVYCIAFGQLLEPMNLTVTSVLHR